MGRDLCKCGRHHFRVLWVGTSLVEWCCDEIGVDLGRVLKLGAQS